MSQIIHCNNQSYKSRYGSTWVLDKVYESNRHVWVQYSICSKNDNYQRKLGVSIAKLTQPTLVLKSKLPEFVNEIKNKFNWNIFTPNLIQLYQAVIRL